MASARSVHNFDIPKTWSNQLLADVCMLMSKLRFSHSSKKSMGPLYRPSPFKHATTWKHTPETGIDLVRTQPKVFKKLLPRCLSAGFVFRNTCVSVTQPIEYPIIRPSSQGSNPMWASILCSEGLTSPPWNKHITPPFLDFAFPFWRTLQMFSSKQS